ncbi:MAG TPA: hypothetical protein VH796_14010 [Nitrososphaeraceae archaeon]
MTLGAISSKLTLLHTDLLQTWLNSTPGFAAIVLFVFLNNPYNLPSHGRDLIIGEHTSLT